MRHAQVKNNVIISLVISPTVEQEPNIQNIPAKLSPGAFWTQVPDNVEAGAKWDGTRYVNQSSIRDTLIPALEFWERFTREERIHLRIAAKTDPVIEDFIDTMKLYMEHNKFISIAANDTVNGFDYLVYTGLMTRERADQFFVPATTTLTK